MGRPGAACAAGCTQSFLPEESDRRRSPPRGAIAAGRSTCALPALPTTAVAGVHHEPRIICANPHESLHSHNPLLYTQWHRLQFEAGGRWATWAGRTLRRATRRAAPILCNAFGVIASAVQRNPGALSATLARSATRARSATLAMELNALGVKMHRSPHLIRCADQNSTLRTSGPEPESEERHSCLRLPPFSCS